MTTTGEFECWLEALMPRLEADRSKAVNRGELVVAEALARRMENVRRAHVELKAFEAECSLGWWRDGQAPRHAGRAAGR